MLMIVKKGFKMRGWIILIVYFYMFILLTPLFMVMYAFAPTMLAGLLDWMKSSR